MMTEERLAEIVRHHERGVELVDEFALREAMRDREDLLAELQTLRERDKWIPVEEKLPEPDSWVLVSLAGAAEWVYYYDDNVWRDSGLHEVEGVTHWRPLPASPKIESEKR